MAPWAWAEKEKHNKPYIGIMMGLCWGYIWVILGLYWGTIRVMYWDYIGGYMGIMESEMEATTVYGGCIGILYVGIILG